MKDTEVALTSSNLRRRNLLTAGALLLIMFTFVPYVGEQRIEWFMWRDLPLLAAVLFTIAVVLLVIRHRIPRE